MKVLPRTCPTAALAPWILALQVSPTLCSEIIKVENNLIQYVKLHGAPSGVRSKKPQKNRIRADRKFMSQKVEYKQ